MASAPTPGAHRRGGDDSDDTTITIKMGDEVYTLRPSELDRVHISGFEDTCSRTVELALMQLESSPGITAVARVLYLCELQNKGVEQARTFREVAESVSYAEVIDSLERVQETGDVEELITDDPAQAVPASPLPDTGAN